MSLASSQSQLLRGVAGANALGAKTETHGRRVSTLVRAGKAWELYNLKADPTETNNLAMEKPEKAKELASLWEAWSRTNQHKQ